MLAPEFQNKDLSQRGCGVVETLSELRGRTMLYTSRGVVYSDENAITLGSLCHDTSNMAKTLASGIGCVALAPRVQKLHGILCMISLKRGILTPATHIPNVPP